MTIKELYKQFEGHSDEYIEKTVKEKRVKIGSSERTLPSLKRKERIRVFTLVASFLLMAVFFIVEIGALVVAFGIAGIMALQKAMSASGEISSKRREIKECQDYISNAASYFERQQLQKKADG